MLARHIALLVLLATAAVASGAVGGERGAPARIVVGSSPEDASSRPKPLSGVPLRGSTGLTLLVANAPPFLLDVDSGRITPIRGLKIGGNVALTVLSAGRNAIVWLDRDRPTTRIPRAEIYLLRRGATRARRLATAWEVAPSADGRAVWLKRYQDARRCTLSEISLDGRARRDTRAVRCSARLVDEGVGAVLVEGGSILDPRTGATVLEAGEAWAMVGDFAVTTEGSQGPLTVSDLGSGERWQLRNPSLIAGQGGRDEAAVERQRQLVALGFSNPAYRLTQGTDVWLLDPATRRLRELPDMPAAVSLKFTSMSWTNDGRLVMLAETEGRDVVAVWQPGQKRIGVRPVRLPPRSGGSDAFVVWRAARPR